jgi:hypothetical protein
MRRERGGEMAEQVHLGFVKNEPNEKIEIIGDTDGTYLIRRWVYPQKLVMDIPLTLVEFWALADIVLRVMRSELKGNEAKETKTTP